MAYITDLFLHLEMPLRTWLDFSLICKSENSSAEKEIVAFIVKRVRVKRLAETRQIEKQNRKNFALRSLLEKTDSTNPPA